MGRQKKDENHVKPQEKVNNFVEPWPNLPQQLLNFIGRQHHDLMQNISFRGVTKSWRVASKHCNANAQLPWLELSDKDHYKSNKIHREHTLNISFRWGEYWWWSKRPWNNPWTHFYGCSHGLIIAGSKDPTEYGLLVPTVKGGGSSYWCVPPWDPTVPFKFATLSSHPSNNYKGCSVLVLTGCSHPLFVVYQFGYQRKWMKQASTIVDPNCSKRQLMTLTNAIGFEGKFYALSSQGTLVLIEETEFEFQVTNLSPSRAVPSVNSKHFTEYLLESNGEILLIFLISEQSIREVDIVEVFKLHKNDFSWLKLENLGNRTLFAGTNCCMSVTASELGCRSNCVYFNEHGTNSWWLYEMESASILPCYDDYGSETKSPVWEEPIVENNCL